MEMNDIRLLTLKRWNLPQTKSLTELKKAGQKLGDYAAFHNFHFIDIAPIHLEAGANPLAASYKAIQEIRKKHHDSAGEGKIPDTYVQQCMALLGAGQEFWMEKANCLSITMVQLTDTTVDFSEIEKQIRKAFSTRNIPDPQWTLYYSFDFCDMVIFVKDAPYHALHDVLWDLSPIHGHQLNYVRDTITIFSFESDYLVSQFEKSWEEADKDSSDEKLTLSAGLSIQAMETWHDLYNQLHEKLPIQAYRALGRFDVQFLIKDISFQQVFRVIGSIDQLCHGDQHNAFGGYEIALFNDFDEELFKTNCSPAKWGPDLFTAAEKKLDEMYRRYEQALAGIEECNWGYAAELKQCILALLRNGFSEEFAISVLMSFIEYLRFVTENAKQIEDALHDDPSSSTFYIFQRKYFQALNMLTHCTMHSEKQFIQAPAFNATLCDIPPKLLACYESFSDQITQILRDEKQRTFSFQIVPDFQPEIYVKPISYGTQGNSKLSIIYLSERLFYDPADVVTVMCHEIAHYVGSNARKRRDRVKLIFSSIGCFLLLNTVPFEEADLKIAGSLGNAFGEVVLERYDRYYKKSLPQSPEEGEEYFLEDIKRFIAATSNLLNCFQSPEFKRDLQKKWVKSLENANVCGLMEKMDNSLSTKYLSQLSADESSKMAALDILAANIFLKLQNFSQELNERLPGELESKQLQKYKDFYLNILGAFREAYSDLRMVELLGFTDGQKYSSTLYSNSKYRLNGRADLQTCLRHDAVCEAVGLKNSQEELAKYTGGSNDSDQTMTLVVRLAKSNLVKYLEECHDPEYTKKSKNLIADVKKLESADPWTLLTTVQEIINDYRERLCKYCQE